MKIEQKQLVGFIGRGIIVLAFSSLYAIGGSGDFWDGQLWIRRWLATFLLCAWGFWLSRDWRSAIFFPLMAGAMTLPYGEDVLIWKILWRGLFGFAAGCAFNLNNVFSVKRSELAIFGVILATMGSITFGAFNPFQDAMIEQGAIGICICLTYVLGIKSK